MRATLTIASDVAEELKAEMRRSGPSLEGVVNDALRKALLPPPVPSSGLPRFTVEPFTSPFQPGVDPTHLGQLADELETDEFRRRGSREG